MRSSAIGENLFINNNDKLTTLPAFSVLQRIGGTLSIRRNTSLLTFSGFDVLATIGDGLSIEVNTKLTSIPSFSALMTIEGSFRIVNNFRLTTLPAFSVLTSVGGLFSISTNGVKSISGFPALKTIGGGFDLLESSLMTVSGFAVLTSIGGEFRLRDNAALSSCCGLLPFVDGSVPPGGSTTIARNAPGCNSAEEIIADCEEETDDTTLGLPSLANDIRFYPNPASQNLYIEGISQETSFIDPHTRWKNLRIAAYHFTPKSSH